MWWAILSFTYKAIPRNRNIGSELCNFAADLSSSNARDAYIHYSKVISSNCYVRGQTFLEHFSIIERQAKAMAPMFSHLDDFSGETLLRNRFMEAFSMVKGSKELLEIDEEIASCMPTIAEDQVALVHCRELVTRFRDLFPNTYAAFCALGIAPTREEPARVHEICILFLFEDAQPMVVKSTHPLIPQCVFLQRLVEMAKSTPDIANLNICQTGFLSHQLIEKVLSFAEHHTTEPYSVIQKPIPSTNIRDFVSPYDADFIESFQQETKSIDAAIWNLLMMANKIGFGPLLDLGCADVAAKMKGKEQKEVIELFGLSKDDVPPELRN